MQMPPVVVQGIMYYPDGSSRTYIVPAGAEIVGAGGVNCRYVVESGGRMTATPARKISTKSNQAVPLRALITQPRTVG